MKRVSIFLPLLLYANFAFGEYITTNVVNGCSDAKDVFYAHFKPNTYTCSSGYYLPANVDECTLCPAGSACSGGTFVFDEKYSQGINYKTPIVENVVYGCNNSLVEHEIITAKFEPNEHTCSAGYYLPANVDECTICPAGNACPGGTFTFNENTNQGIQSCSDNTVPAGFAICTQHRLHIGDDVVYVRSTKLTTPSLNIDIDNDGVADFFINMTTTRTRMNKDSEHYFHAQWENNDYYICDDTTCPQ